MQVEHKLQIDVIKGARIYYKEYENYFFVADGHIGVYLKDKELKIDKSKMIKILSNKDSISFFPDDLLKERTPAIETRIARKLPGTGYAIKLYSKESGEYCFVDEKYLKMFKGYNNLYIKSKKDPVLIYRYGVPYGIILPMYISEQEGEWWKKIKSYNQ